MEDGTAILHVPATPEQFPPTQRGLIALAGAGDSPGAREAFGRFYLAYRKPLLAYLRREGRPESELNDLLHAFVEDCLAKNRLAQFDGPGRFRSWLLTCFKHFLADVWDRQQAAKRGGKLPHLPLDGTPESEPIEAPWPGRTPVQEYDRQFALQLLGRVVKRLRTEYQTREKAALYERIYPFLLEKKTGTSHAVLGEALGMSGGSISQEISRLRQRFRELFDAEVEALVGSEDEVEAEKQYLLSAIRS